ncbi:sensor histidine kinase [Paenibacillus mendelii]|nr:sensor histidine kinase [Paenibacillus mendelii]
MELLKNDMDESSISIGDFIDSIHVSDARGHTYIIGGGTPLQYRKAFELMPFEYEHTPQWAFFTDDGRIACQLKLTEPGSGDLLGTIIMALDSSKIASLYDHLPEGSFYITNSENLIMSAAVTEEIGSVAPADTEANKLTLTQKSRYSDFQYLYMTASEPGAIVMKQALFSFYVTLLAWICVIVITYWILRHITIPLTGLTRLMRRAGREDYSLMEEVHTQDEVALLCHGYNQMVNRTRELIEKNYKSELLKREAELQAVQMYINPHFLFNTLEYISIQSEIPERASHVPDALQRLASILRYSIAPGGNTVTLAAELSMVETYFQIHQYRYEEQLQFTVHLPDAFRNIPVPKLILQPLIENAFIHGVDYCTEGGYVIVDVFEEDFDLMIKIENSIPSGDYSRTSNERSRRSIKRKGFGSGLVNVNDRIRYQFGEKYGVKLVCHADRAIAVIRMPIIIEGG